MNDIEKNRDISRDLLQALASNDKARIDMLFHEDAQWWVLGAGTMSRRALLEASAQAMSTAIVAQMNILATTAEGERVAVEAEGNFEFADGKVYRNRYHFLLIVRDGQVIEGREYLDTALVARTFPRS